MAWFKSIKNIYLLVLLISVMAFLGACVREEEKSKLVSINGQEIKVEVAETPLALYRGLSGRNDLCADCGMLFVFKNKEDKTFVMRDMNFNLDIVWIEDNKIIKVDKNLSAEGSAPSNFYLSGAPVNYVLEVNAGYAATHNFKAGDEVMLNL